MEYNIGQNPIFLAKCSIFSYNYKERPEFFFFINCNFILQRIKSTWKVLFFYYVHVFHQFGKKWRKSSFWFIKITVIQTLMTVYRHRSKLKDLFIDIQSAKHGSVWEQDLLVTSRNPRWSSTHHIFHRMVHFIWHVIILWWIHVLFFNQGKCGTDLPLPISIVWGSWVFTPLSTTYPGADSRGGAPGARLPP